MLERLSVLIRFGMLGYFESSFAKRFDAISTASPMLPLVELLCKKGCMTTFPLILLAIAFGLLILLQAVLVDAVSVQSRRLDQMTRHLRELSEFVRQQAQPVVRAGDEVYGEERNRAA